jgi:hypothetical protein
LRRTARPAVLPAADRTIRLAVGATPEFADAVRRATPGGTSLSNDELRRKVIMKVVTNVQATYQRELGIRFQLVKNKQPKGERGE